MTSEKIRPHHLERKAILYVRQSSAHQVLHNRESSALQYAMRDRLTALGWSRIDTVDDDLGRSAAGGVARAGFDRMVAGVCLGKVGAVAAREVSRFARNSRDWQQLIEMCRVVDTVLRKRRRSGSPPKRAKSKGGILCRMVRGSSADQRSANRRLSASFIARGRTQITPRDRIRISKTSSLQSHRQMGVMKQDCNIWHKI